MLGDVVIGVVDIAGEHLFEFVEPLMPLRLVGTDKRMHGKHVHLVIVGLRALGHDPVAQHGVIDNVVAAHEPGKVEGLAGRVERRGSIACVLADRLGGDVLVIPQSQIGPNLVGNDHAIVGLVHFHGLLDFPTLPHAPARIVRAAEHGHMDVMLLELLIHILVIHAPYAVLVQLERAVDDAIAVVLDAHGEPDVGRAVQEHAVARSGERGQRTDHAAQDPVLIADRLAGQSGNPIARGLPVDNGVVIVVGGGEVPVDGVLRAFDNGLRNRGHGREIHVRHPHRNHVKSVPRWVGSET